MKSAVYVSKKAPAPVGPYSHAVRRGPLLALAGQVGIDPETGSLVPGGVAEQTRRTLENLSAVLTEAGASFEDVIMMRVYLTDAAHFPEMNAVYTELVGEPHPCRTTVFVGLGPGMLVEIDALAVAG
ncbi:RidA family protein [Nonomuraea cavernae]|uniref:Reactive intermediate/imine deaminase n=1 Tax=Nonomuraea cavernae TaxID=2045107 RepID=A0A917YN78_9ACTN|nr:Rid family detoxifying hydrolase [Nonomuraea cavernae]MCA2183668.1 RidA family protein [Nonomuraea cavernae]GGO61000.1 reactive intermediate/imine deaminase [Nonomuraea cavernae]